MAYDDHEESVSALLVGAYERDRQLLHEIFRNPGWKLFEAASRRRALRYLDRYPIQVVIAQAEVPEWGWRRVLRDLRDRDRPPQLIVTSRNADDRLWAEALNLGAFDVLAEPFERHEVERAVESARRHIEVPKRSPERATTRPGVLSGAA